MRQEARIGLEPAPPGLKAAAYLTEPNCFLVSKKR